MTNDELVKRLRAAKLLSEDGIKEAADAIEALEARIATIEAATVERCAQVLDNERLEQADANNAAWVDCEPTIGLHIEKAYAEAARMIRALAPLDTEKYKAEKRCCSVCDRKKVCHVCGEQTLLACSDCQINFAATVYVCQKSACRDAHERKCFGALAPLDREAMRDDHIDEGTLADEIDQIDAMGVGR